MKKIYITPTLVVEKYEIEDLLYTASPGIGKPFEDDMPIESKRGSGFFEYEDYSVSFDDDLVDDNDIY